MEEGFRDLFQATVDALNNMGLTVYEAKTYLTLLQKHPSHGHEISRRSGVPGPKIYETLSRMVQKGLVAVLNTDPQMYSPLPYQEFLTRKSNEFQVTEQLLAANLEKISMPAVDITLWQLTNHDVLIAKARDLIDGAKKAVLTSMWPPQGRLLEKSLAAARQRGVAIVSIQFEQEVIEVGKVFRHVQVDTVYDRHSGELTMVVDESVGLFMSRPPDREWNGFWTTNPGVVKLMTNYIRHDIYSNKLIYRFEKAVKEEFGEQLQELLNLEVD
ncbi:MAG TPA: helix-turn-helix domain-containing protein [Syntrophales bacterium]|nr:helix-turn-helix domain-containing protein [Syntrophales bacterium]HPX82268.1 helix-turn-helix domain-containing protein [Syntrophales bacterium]HQB13630.1 helix-turn-helix domain-containing protein [Syntrophales bacterium]